MPRRLRKEPSLLEVALESRWHVSAFLAGAALLAMLIIPAIFRSAPALMPLAGMIRTLLWIPVAGFGLIAVVKWFQESHRDREPVSANRRAQPLPLSAREKVVPIVDRPGRSMRSERLDPTARQDDQASPSAIPRAWSLDLLQSIDWKRFEDVVAAYFHEKNFRCETVAYGADDGIDGRLYFGDIPTPVGIIQCKAWARLVGVAPVRELLGVMAHEKVDRGYFCATGSFTAEAVTFASKNPIKLIGGQDFLDAIGNMAPGVQQRLLELCTSGDYTTPTCASCGIKLVQKTIGGRQAWACRNFPRCRMKIWIRSAERGPAAKAAAR